MIQQDIAQGNGFAVIDPHGDLIEDIKSFFALRYKKTSNNWEITQKVVLIDPTDPYYTVTFNPLEALSNTTIGEQVTEFISAFKRNWNDSWGVRMEDLLRNSLIALGEAKETLITLSFFLTNRSFRSHVLSQVTHPAVLDYFHRFDMLTDRSQLTWIEPVMNKINSFFANDLIRQMFASPVSSFNLREIMDKKRILLIKLDKGKLKDSADLLGSLFMAKIQITAFSRSDLPENQRTPFYLYIDEFQNFANESFAIILSEARKYALSLIMIHQTLSQIPPELKGLILGNAGIQVYFRLNRNDAEHLSREAFQYSGYGIKTVIDLHPKFWSYSEEWEHKTEELQHLLLRTAYVKHKIEGGLIHLQTVDIPPIWDILDIKQSEWQDYINKLPFGQQYLVSREELSRIERERKIRFQKEVKEKVEEKVEDREDKSKKEVEVSHDEIVKKPVSALSKKEANPPVAKLKGESLHRYFQTLIKKFGEDKGYKSEIEKSIPDSFCKIDVALEREGPDCRQAREKIACEISITTTPEQELGNILKCLKAGYDPVVLISPDKKTLTKIKDLVLKEVDQADQSKVLFFLPEEFIIYLEEIAANRKNQEETIKGYKVNVKFQPLDETEKKARQQAIAQILLKNLQRLKDDEGKKS